MTRLGLIGGVSPEATQIYYRHLNAAARARFGGQHSANVLFYMLDYGVMIRHYHEENWGEFVAEVVKAAESLKAGGAEMLVITSGTTHVGARAAAEATGLPLIHMMDCLSDEMVSRQSQRPLLLGTPWVMSGGFFRPELLKRFEGDPIVPAKEDREMVGDIIFNELVNGEVKAASREKMAAMVSRYQSQGADGVILGCTELCMILEQADCDISVFDVTAIHANKAAEVMLD